MSLQRLIIFIIICLSISGLYSQEQKKSDIILFKKPERNKDVKLKQTLQKKGHTTKAEWITMIDERWGEGLPTSEKLSLFDKFWSTINTQYPSFHNLTINWDSLRNVYRTEVEAGISRGRFIAIMQWLTENLSDFHTQIRDNIVGYDRSSLVCWFRVS